MPWAATSSRRPDRLRINSMYNVLNTVGTLAALSLAISHMGWLITQSGIMRPLRELVTQPTLREGIHCIICTTTQLSLLLAWLVPDVVDGPAPVVYVVKAMMLAKVSLVVYDLGEAMGVLSVGSTYDGDTVHTMDTTTDTP